MTGRSANLVWRLGALIRPFVTLGVRCLVTDGAGRVLLVRHTYISGWHFPGGGVDPHESSRAAAAREVREETGYSLAAEPAFFGLYWNKALAGRDHVALYIAEGDVAIGEDVIKAQGPEIAEARLFEEADLPADTVGAVRRRLAEWRGGEPRAELW